MKNKGITLIALIITIIVLLILAGVAIASLSGENGLFTKTKTAKKIYEYTSAKEIIEMKLMEVQADCIEKRKEYTIEEVARNIKEDKQITIEKYYNSNTASIKQGIEENLVNLNGIIVSVDKYSEYKFLIGEDCKIEGVTDKEITDATKKEDLKTLEEFEKEEFGSSVENKEEKEETKEIPSVDESIDTSKPIEITTYMTIKSNSKNTLNITDVENVVYTMKEKTENINLEGNILTANNKADSKDSCKIEITGTYKEQSYKNNLIVYVEPKNMTRVNDKEGNSKEAYGIYTKEDLLRFQEIVENIDNTCNAKLMQDIELNSSEQYEFGENGKITFKETATQYSSIGSVERRYSGIFDGNKKQIIGLYIKEENKNAVGLFDAVTQEGEVKNLTIKDSYIFGYWDIGAIIGYNEGEITRCKVENTTIESSGLWTGGISGINNGKIIECALIDSYMYGDAIGGIVGSNGTNDERDYIQKNKTTGYIYRCYSTGYIIYRESGGIASHNGAYGGEGYIYDCYSRSYLQDSRRCGSIVSIQSISGRGGYIYNSYYLNKQCNFPNVATLGFYGNVTNSYSNDETVTAEKLNGEEGTVWVNNNGYPILKWQLE